MARNQNLVSALSRRIELSVTQCSVREARVNADFILTFLKLLQLTVRQTKAPIFLVVAGSIGTPIGPIRE
jgi:pantothenate kinase-related protein Tda10